MRCWIARRRPRMKMSARGKSALRSARAARRGAVLAAGAQAHSGAPLSQSVRLALRLALQAPSAQVTRPLYAVRRMHDVTAAARLLLRRKLPSRDLGSRERNPLEWTCPFLFFRDEQGSSSIPEDPYRPWPSRKKRGVAVMGVVGRRSFMFESRSSAPRLLASTVSQEPGSLDPRPSTRQGPSYVVYTTMG